MRDFQPKTIIEPFRIRSVEPVHFTTRAQREAALQAAGAPRGFVSFTALPVLLARATLDRVERFGAGSSISRADVAALMGRLHLNLEAGVPALA